MIGAFISLSVHSIPISVILERIIFSQAEHNKNKILVTLIDCIQNHLFIQINPLKFYLIDTRKNEHVELLLSH